MGRPIARTNNPSSHVGEEQRRAVGDAGVQMGSNLAMHPGYDTWPEYGRAIYDMHRAEVERMRRLQEEEARRNREFRMSMAYALELDINNRYIYNEQVRHWNDYNAGLPYHESAPPVNWEEVSRQSPRQPQPYPQSYASSWLPLQPPPPPEGTSEQAGVFETRGMYNGLMSSFFGPSNPYPPRDPNNVYGYQ